MSSWDLVLLGIVGRWDYYIEGEEVRVFIY